MSFGAINSGQKRKLIIKQMNLGTLKPLINGATSQDSRPNVALFKQRTKAEKGLWDCMALWEETGLSPVAVSHVKMVTLAKKDQSRIPAFAFRPIAVQSVWWRAWASTWLGGKMTCSWVTSSFPKSMLGGIPESIWSRDYGCYPLLQTCGSEVCGFLDLKHACSRSHRHQHGPKIGAV